MEYEIIKSTNKILEIIVVDEIVLPCKELKLCAPEAFFEMIERCSRCGKFI
jgi:hypothetical protein